MPAERRQLDVPGRPEEMRFVARQPILNAAGRVVAYELLYRGSLEAESCTADSDRASAQVLTDGLLAFGLPALANGKLLFINFTRHWLVEDAAFLLPSPYFVLELTEDIPADDDTIDACRRLHAAGYAIALDDFEEGSAAEAFLPWASYVKVDVLATPPERVASLMARLKGRPLRMLAEKVETQAVADWSAKLGFELFQGYYFARPATMTTRALPPQRVAYLDLLAAVNQPEITLEQLETLVKRDPALSHRVLRCLQSASYGLRRDVSSIREALLLLGIEPVRRWASVWALAGLNGDGSPEVISMALIRARTCEQAASRQWGPAAGEPYYLLGLCSLLDVLLEQSIAVAVADLPLQPLVREALLGTPGPARALLNCTIAYEQGDWVRAVDAAHEAGLDMVTVADAYGEALHWALALADAQASRSTAPVAGSSRR